MKKAVTWALVLSLCLALTCVPAMAEGIYTPGTYTGTGAGHENGLSVTVTVDENSITEVKVDVSNETPLIGGLAGEELEAQILAAQGTEIDGVSGATETSGGVKRAWPTHLRRPWAARKPERRQRYPTAASRARRPASVLPVR